jgi:hypothetical protein
MRAKPALERVAPQILLCPGGAIRAATPGACSRRNVSDDFGNLYTLLALESK